MGILLRVGGKRPPPMADSLSLSEDLPSTKHFLFFFFLSVFSKPNNVSGSKKCTDINATAKHFFSFSMYVLNSIPFPMQSIASQELHTT